MHEENDKHFANLDLRTQEIGIQTQFIEGFDKLRTIMTTSVEV